VAKSTYFGVLAMAKLEFFNPKGLPPTSGDFHWASKADNTVYLGGQVPIDKDRNIVGIGDAAAQTVQIFANIETTLRELGGDLNNLVMLTMYVVGRESLEGIRAGRQQILEEGRMSNQPPVTLVFVAGLANEQWLLEVDSIAVLD
jgi:2-iminobutanoate/2-iminopropanoate deaminase